MLDIEPSISSASSAFSAQAAPSLKLRFNGAALVIQAGDTLEDLLAAQDLPPDAIATAVNGQFIARDQRATASLNAGDDVITFQAIVGG